MIGKLFKNKQIVTIVALIVCFAILVIAYNYRVGQAISAVSVPIATRDIYARELIDETCFETKKVAQSMLSPTVIKDPRLLVGGENTPAKYVNYNTFIPEGSMFYTQAVTTWDRMPDSAWADLEDGFTIFSLHVDSEDTYGNSIFPGDKIDLYFTDKDPSTRKPFIGPLINGITVLAVKDSDGQHIFKRSAEQQNASELIFAVENDKFLFLKDAQAIHAGGIIPVPRNAEYSETGKEEKGSKYITNYIKMNSKISVDDEKINKNTKTSDVKVTE